MPYCVFFVFVFLIRFASCQDPPLSWNEIDWVIHSFIFPTACVVLIQSIKAAVQVTRSTLWFWLSQSRLRFRSLAPPCGWWLTDTSLTRIMLRQQLARDTSRSLSFFFFFYSFFVFCLLSAHDPICGFECVYVVLIRLFQTHWRTIKRLSVKIPFSIEIKQTKQRRTASDSQLAHLREKTKNGSTNPNKKTDFICAIFVFAEISKKQQLKTGNEVCFSIFVFTGKAVRSLSLSPSLSLSLAFSYLSICRRKAKTQVLSVFVFLFQMDKLEIGFHYPLSFSPPPPP